MDRFTVWLVEEISWALVHARPNMRSVGWMMVKKEPPVPPDGYWPVWTSTHDPKLDPEWAEDGDWVLEEDHRKGDLWLERGKKYTLGADHDGATYNGLGPIPAWLHAAEPPAPPLTLEQLRAAQQAAATARRWGVMTGGITLQSGVRIGTTIDDQNRITSVVANAALAGLADVDLVDFKATSGWIQISIGDIKQVAGAIGQFVQDCYTAERVHHDAIEAITDYVELQGYDVATGWPDDGSSQGAA